MADVRIESLTKDYGALRVLHGIDLSIADGEFVALVGPSGCGKSTTLRMLAGLEDISDGTISIGGAVVNDVEPSDRGIAMVFQSYALYPHMSVSGNMGYALKVAGRSKAEIADRVEQAARILGLKELLDRRPADLSGGQRQRVAMGRAIVRRPQVFLFDEPLSNLDAKLRTQMRSEIKRIHREVGATTIYVTHDQVEAMTLADRIVIMRDGRLEQVGTPEQVFEQPRTAFVAAFIGAPPMNLVPATMTDEALRLAGGKNVPLDPMRYGGSDSAGRDVLFGLRPDDIVPVGHGMQAAHPWDIEVEITASEPLGGETLVFFALVPGTTWIGRMLKPRPLELGERITLRLDLARARVFDAATGLRLTED